MKDTAFTLWLKDHKNYDIYQSELLAEKEFRKFMLGVLKNA